MTFMTPIVRVVKKVSENVDNHIRFFLYKKELDYISNHKIHAFKYAKNLIIMSFLCELSLKMSIERMFFCSYLYMPNNILF